MSKLITYTFNNEVLTTNYCYIGRFNKKNAIKTLAEKHKTYLNCIKILKVKSCK